MNLVCEKQLIAELLKLWGEIIYDTNHANDYVELLIKSSVARVTCCPYS